MHPLHSLIIGKVRKLLDNTNIGIVCIDGPTAAGKTILAEDLAKIINSQLSIKVDFYRLDWTLKKRLERENDLKNLMNDNDPFYFEGELHMHLNKYKNFLEELHIFKKNVYSYKSKEIEKSLLIKDLYSREMGGTCEGEYSYDLSSEKTLIICEGHYTSRSEFRNLIDLNICLLADKDELLKRKINRVKDYRSPNSAIDYFKKIDIPSFSYHISRFYRNIDIFVDNTDYLNPLIISPNKIGDWFLKDIDKLNNNTKILDKKVNFKLIFDEIFSSSKIDQFVNLEQFKIVFNLYNFLDQLVSKKLQNNTKTNDNDIHTIVSEQLDHISKKAFKNNIHMNLSIVSSSSLHDVYQRKIPVSIGLKYTGKNDHQMFINYNININFVDILFLWEGGAYEIKIKRSLNNIEKKFGSESVEMKNFSLQLLNNKKNKIDNLKVLYTPSDFCVPSFIKDEKFNIIFTGREHESISIFDICKKVITNPESIFCHRVSKYSEISFFKKLFELCGLNCLNISNYLICVNSNNKDLIESFQSWSKSWFSFERNNIKDQIRYDLEVRKEIVEANLIVSKKYSSFIMVDSFLFENQDQHDLNKVIDDLKNMLKSSNRIIRKRAFEYINNDQNGLEINTKEFLKINEIECEHVDKETFPLADLPSLYPSIMAEIYLWLHLRGDASAILGANVYDIDKNNSLDIEAILESSSNKQTPVVLQSSFNALGQEEIKDYEKKIGYLQLENGAFELVDACIKSNLKNILIKGCSRTFFGIGLDHVDAKNDNPIGRAKRFLESALETGQITHIVLDGSFLFNAEDRNNETINKAYQKVANYAISLLDTKNDNFLIDLEYCVGEMNYIGNLSDSMIPTPQEIRLFSNIVRKKLTNIDKGHFNCRPILFIGNVGTTHHTKDNKKIDSTIAFDWVENIKDQNYISAVLHGTTNSDSIILKNSTKGCHKVNVAGDFLKIYQSSLPSRFDEKLRRFTPDSKYQMSNIRKLKSHLNKKEKEEIIKNLKNSSNNFFGVINSPKLTSRDINYFHRSSYKFSSKNIDYILSIFKNSKEKIAKNKFNKKNYGNLSFSASMIEVPYEEGFIDIAYNLINLGQKYFHIDVGDGEFISRKFSGIKKLEYLSSLNTKLNLHTHLMVKDPFSKLPNNKTYIDSYIESGTTSLGLHSRSFKNKKNLKKAFEYIKSSGCRPGLVIEVNQSDFQELWSLILYLEINWVIIMGVPIGYGGQLFQTPSLKKINYLRKMSIENKVDKFDIEIDGGLTFNNILDCLNSGANIFAGWSIIKDKKLSKILSNFKQLNSQFLA